MKTTKRHLSYFLLLLFIFSLCISCGKRQVYNNPVYIEEASSYYEKAWVDPKITYTDSLLTIIKANRVDSFFVDKPAPKFKNNITSLAFEVKEQNCFTSVLLLNNFGDLLSVLVADELSIGHYKVSLNSTQISYMQLSAERFFLKIDYCGFSVIKEIR